MFRLAVLACAAGRPSSQLLFLPLVWSQTLNSSPGNHRWIAISHSHCVLHPRLWQCGAQSLSHIPWNCWLDLGDQSMKAHGWLLTGLLVHCAPATTSASDAKICVQQQGGLDASRTQAWLSENLLHQGTVTTCLHADPQRQHCNVAYVSQRQVVLSCRPTRVFNTHTSSNPHQ